MLLALSRKENKENGMHTKHFYRLVVSAMLLLAGMPAWAHPSFQHSGFWAGLAHPFLGPDHVLAAFGIGVWAWSRRIAADKQTYKSYAPAVCLGMIFCTLLFAAGLPAASLEWLLAGSVLGTGLMILLAARLPLRGAALLAGFFIACHAGAHLIEMPADWRQSAYATTMYAGGFLAATLMLFAGGLCVARWLETSPARRGLPLTGGLLAAGGLYLLNAV